MYKELVKRLRDAFKTATEAKVNPYRFVPYYAKAADAIEELAKYLERSKDFEAFWQREAEEALRKFQVAVANKPRWIPVTERLPENAGEYIVYLHPWDDGTMDDWGYTTAMHFDKGQSLWICDGTSYNAVLSAVNTETEYHITHWMPLPTPPKEET